MALCFPLQVPQPSPQRCCCNPPTLSLPLPRTSTASPSATATHASPKSSSTCRPRTTPSAWAPSSSCPRPRCALTPSLHALLPAAAKGLRVEECLHCHGQEFVPTAHKTAATFVFPHSPHARTLGLTTSQTLLSLPLVAGVQHAVARHLPLHRPRHQAEGGRLRRPLVKAPCWHAMAIYCGLCQRPLHRLVRPAHGGWAACLRVVWDLAPCGVLRRLPMLTPSAARCPRPPVPSDPLCQLPRQEGQLQAGGAAGAVSEAHTPAAHRFFAVFSSHC